MRLLFSMIFYLILTTLSYAQNETSIGCTLTDADCPPTCVDCALGYTGGGCSNGGVDRSTCTCNKPPSCIPSTTTTSQTTTTVQGQCDWCGYNCVRVYSDTACALVAPPSDKQCVEENGQCVIKPTSTTIAPTTTTTTKPSITVISPNGGETWVIGSTVTISWTSTNVNYVYLDMTNKDGGYSFGNSITNLVNVEGNPGKTTWTIPTYANAGSYKLKIGTCSAKTNRNDCGGASVADIYDYSDGIITLVAPTKCDVELCKPYICCDSTKQACPLGFPLQCETCSKDICPSVTTTTLIGTEEYCHKFTYDRCPSQCEVGPSCPICLDIGCHAKGAHTPKCGNGICEEGEADYCIPCTSEPCPLAPCRMGTCPKDCPSTTTTLQKCPTIQCVWDPCPGNHISDANGCVNCASPCGITTTTQVTCIQVITPAKNPLTGECREFPTPCDVPANWIKVNSCSSVECCFDTFSRSCFKGFCASPNQYQVPCDSSLCKPPEDCPKLMPPSPDYCKDGKIKTIINDRGCVVGYECEQTQIRKCPEYVMCPDGTKNPCYQSGDTCSCKQCEYHCKKICREIGTEKEGWYDSCTNNLIKFDKCGGESIRIPSECKSEIDESGFVRVRCERICPEIPSYQKEKCLNSGGNVVIRKDYSGCEYVECLFESSTAITPTAYPVPIFTMSYTGQAHRCPTEEELNTTLTKCGEVGGRGVIEYEHGCKIPKCIHEEERGCSDITPPREAIGKECESKGLKVVKDFDPQTGCPILRCGEKEFCHKDVTEKIYEECKERGGELTVKKNDDGCVVFYDCLTRGDERQAYVERVERIPDTSELLSLALKLDSLKIELDKLSKETHAIANYYRSINSPEEEKYRRVSSMFETAKGKIDEIKSKIKLKTEGGMTKDDVVEIKRDVRYIKEVMLKDILYLMLSSGDDARKIAEGTSDDCKGDSSCFERAFRICKKVSFAPEGEDGPQVTVIGIEDKKCVMEVQMKGSDMPGGLSSMTCKFENYALGFNEKEDFFSLCEGPLVKYMKMKYENMEVSG